MELETPRYRRLGMMVFGVVVGALFIWKLGTVGKGLGVVLTALGAYALYGFVRTMIFPPGTVVVADDRVELPRGVCAGAPVIVKPAEVGHAYLLRRSVPWSRAAPVLVIEAQGKAFDYPRDWFVSEADQRRIVRELHARGVGGAQEPAAAAAAEERGAST